ncbi:cupin domain-containing protein [Leucobacter tenebrionis]|uniref:cupin domain-containing protein n=1 Tax=Leucobacter tenebrionis TaxID=2873270 RepID=UPI001CA75694|nr:cupin domain-containing protein [Leucobacter tenebrionis]QZY50735.1 cupin domain-containing protein [Leucobacter tenebrionis]
MTQAIVITDVVTTDAGEHRDKATAEQPGQTESSRTVWESAEGIRSGVWEVTPGSFSSTRPEYHEMCQIVSGRATIEEADGTAFEVGPGSLFITPEGWTGRWTVHETLRKVWVVIPFAALAAPVRGEA